MSEQVDENVSEPQVAKEPQVEEVVESEQGVALEDKQGEESIVSPSLTKKEILELVKGALKEATPDIVGQATKHAQSLTDKASNRLKERIGELGKIGVEVTDSQRVQLGNVINEQIRQEEQGSEDVAPEGELKGIVAVVANRQAKLIKKYGTKIEENDEQSKLVDWENENPFVYLDQYESALKEKVALQNESSEEEADSESGSSVVHASSKGGLTPDKLKGKSPTELISLGYKESAKRRSRR